mgnify:CR=1 FL=1
MCPQRCPTAAPASASVPGCRKIRRLARKQAPMQLPRSTDPYGSLFRLVLGGSAEAGADCWAAGSCALPSAGRALGYPCCPPAPPIAPAGASAANANPIGATTSWVACVRARYGFNCTVLCLVVAYLLQSPNEANPSKCKSYALFRLAPQAGVRPPNDC